MRAGHLFRFQLVMVFIISLVISACNSSDDQNSNSSGPEVDGRFGVEYSPLQGIWLSECYANPEGQGHLITERRVEGGQVRVTIQVYNGAGCDDFVFEGWIELAYEVGEEVLLENGQTARQIDLKVTDEVFPGFATHDEERDIFKIDGDQLILGDPQTPHNQYPTSLDDAVERVHYRQ